LQNIKHWLHSPDKPEAKGKWSHKDTQSDTKKEIKRTLPQQVKKSWQQ